MDDGQLQHKSEESAAGGCRPARCCRLLLPRCDGCALPHWLGGQALARQVYAIHPAIQQMH